MVFSRITTSSTYYNSEQMIREYTLRVTMRQTFNFLWSRIHIVNIVNCCSVLLNNVRGNHLLNNHRPGLPQ